MMADEWWSWDSTLGSQAPAHFAMLPAHREMQNEFGFGSVWGLCCHQEVPQLLEYWRGAWKLLNVAGGRLGNSLARMCRQ